MFRAPQVNLYVADVDATVAFYWDLLGFTETFRTPQQGTPAHVELRLDGFTLGLASAGSLRAVHGVNVPVGPGPRAELVLWTDDTDAAFASVTAKGATVLSPPHDFLSAPPGSPTPMATPCNS